MPKWNQNAYRPKPFYFINTSDDAALSREAIHNALLRLKEAAYGGCVVFNKPPTGFSQEEWLGPGWFRVVRDFAEASLSLGLEIWVNDAFDYPPGDAGGRVQKLAPQLKQQRLVLDENDKVEVKDVTWGFPAFEEPESSRLFIELVYEAYKRELGDLFGNGIVGFFSDADNRRMHHGAMAETYFPWSGNFAATFEKTFGYDITPHLSGILQKKSCQASEDYWFHAGRIYQQWFANNYEWCHANNLQYTFHSGDSGPFSSDEEVRSSIFTEGDSLGMHSHSDFPGTDHELRTLVSATHFKPEKLWFIERAFWGEPRECRSPYFYETLSDVRAKLAGSNAFLLGRKGAMCELFAASNWSAETDELRQIGVWQIMQGINFLVPHAVHHRFFGDTKYFAPPEFLRCDTLQTSLHQLNDYLSELCAIASQGKLLAPVAILDPTTTIWRNHKPNPRFFELCAKLNRLPQGYVIAPLTQVIEAKHQFKLVVNPGLTLSDSERTSLSKAGLTLLEGEELHRLAEFVPINSSYTGSGQPHFMRRKIKGGELLLVANIENIEEIKGEVKYGDKSYSIALLPGEVAVFEPDFQRYRKPRCQSTNIPLDTHVKVAWGAPNSLPLRRWEDVSGKAIDNAALLKGGKFFFRWRNLETIPAPKLLVSLCNFSSCSLNGQKLSSSQRRQVFDDEYLEFPLENAGTVGEHSLMLCCDNYSWKNPSYLEGDFDCEVIGSDLQTKGGHCYNLQLTLPVLADITLKQRRQVLDVSSSWAEQGHPCYSGTASYHFEFNIPSRFKCPVLRLGKVHCRAELTVNGKKFGSLAWAPYEFDLKKLSGHCVAQLTVENTLGNRFDGYGAPSGLAAVPVLLDAFS